MSSENPIGADNQQETISSALDPGWVVGFVDGEGCFSVSIHQNDLARPTRWLARPADVPGLPARRPSRRVLEELRAFFGCGNVRSKGPSELSRRLRSAQHHPARRERIIPFFEEYELRVKRKDFEHVRRHRAGRFELEAASSTRRSSKRSSGCAYSMNARGKQRKRSDRRDPDGILRDCTQGTADESAVKIQSDPHGDMGSQAEMIWPLTANVRSNKNA